VAAGLSFLQTKSYSAQAALEAQNPANEAGYADLFNSTQQLPAETSSQLEQTVTNVAVLRRVKSTLGLKDSIDTIRSNIAVSQDTQSDFVIVDGSADTAEGAAALTNAVVNTVVALADANIQAQFFKQALGVQKEAASLMTPYAGKKYATLTGAQRVSYQQAATQAQQLEVVAAHLQAFSKIVTVAQVATPASLPSSPSSAHVLEFVIIGAVVGLLLGLLVAWFLESIDRRLRRPDEVESLLGLPIVGALPKGSLGKEPGQDKDAATIAAFRMLRTNVRFLASNGTRPPTSILVTSAVAEEGKTTVAMGIALSGAASGLNTLLIEADVHRPVHAKRMGTSAGPGLADHLRFGVSPQQVLQVHAFSDPVAAEVRNGNANSGQPRLACITAGDVSAFSGDALGSKKFAEVIESVGQVYDLVVIDSAPLLAVAETSEIAAMVDAIVFCVRLGKTTAEQVRRARTMLDRLPTPLSGLVVTDLTSDLDGHYGYGYANGYEQHATHPEGAAPATA
jgi:polysaccharide biosynthesis transport protein